MKKQTWIIISGIVIVLLIVVSVIVLFPKDDARAQHSPSSATAQPTPTQELSGELPFGPTVTQTEEPSAPITTASKATTQPTATKQTETQPMVTDSDELLIVPGASQTTKPTPTSTEPPIEITETTYTTKPTPTASPKPEQTDSNELPFVPAG